MVTVWPQAHVGTRRPCLENKTVPIYGHTVPTHAIDAQGNRGEIPAELTVTETVRFSLHLLKRRLQI